MRRKDVCFVGGLCFLAGVLGIFAGTRMSDPDLFAKQLSSSNPLKVEKGWHEPATDYIDTNLVTAPVPGLNKILKWDGSAWVLATDETGTGVPPGVIVMWSGLLANIPAGWVLCDGTGGTPDLRDRFILGVQSGEDPGATGGAHTYSLTVAQLPAHTHTITINTAGSHTHSFTTDATGSGASIDNRPAYYKLAFIMKL